MVDFSRLSPRLPALAVGALLLAQPLRAQKFEGVLTVHSASMGAAAGMQYFIKGDRIRLEITTPGQPSIVMISDGVARKQYVLFQDQKVYTSTTFAELLRSTDSIRKKSAALLQDASIAPAGSSATVAGHKCSVYHYRDARTAYDICLTTELGALGGVSGLFGNVGPTLDAAPPPAWVQPLLKAGSFALRLADSGGKTLWEVKKVEPKTLDGGLFAPPAGFVVLADSSAKPKRPSLY